MVDNIAGEETTRAAYPYFSWNRAIARVGFGDCMDGL